MLRLIQEVFSVAFSYYLTLETFLYMLRGEAYFLYLNSSKKDLFVAAIQQRLGNDVIVELLIKSGLPSRKLDCI